MSFSSNIDYHPVVAKIAQRLDDAGITYKTFEHEAVRTSEEAAATRPGYTLDQGSKALIVRIKRPGEKTFAMLVLPGGARFNTKKAREVMNAKDLRFATPEEVDEITGGVQPGGVPPFGDMFGVEVYMDKALQEYDEIVFNCGDRRASIAMKRTDYEELVHPIIDSFIEE